MDAGPAWQFPGTGMQPMASPSSPAPAPRGGLKTSRRLNKLIHRTDEAISAKESLRRSEARAPRRWLRPLILGAGGLSAVVGLWLWTQRGAGTDPNAPAPAEAAPIRRAGQARDVSALTDAARHTDPKVSAMALDELARVYASAGRTELDKGRRDGRAEVREVAVNALASALPRREARVLVECLADSSPGVRAAAARGLGRTRSWEGVVALVDHLDDADYQVRRCAIEAIQRSLGVSFGYYSPGASAADRQKAIAQMRQEIPRFQRAHEAFLRRLDEKEPGP